MKLPGEEDGSNLCREAGDRPGKVATRPIGTARVAASGPMLLPWAPFWLDCGMSLPPLVFTVLRRSLLSIPLFHVDTSEAGPVCLCRPPQLSCGPEGDWWVS